MSAVLAIIFAVIIVVADQITKYLVVTNMALGQQLPLIPGIIGLNRIEPNSGAAFGMFAGQTWFLIAVTGIIMIICVCMLIKKVFDSNLMFWALCLVLSGGVGNMIDRIFRGGNVVDFLEFRFFDFPVFNVADCAVCIGAGLIVIYFFIDFIKDAKNKNRMSKVAGDSKALDAEAGPLPMNGSNENDE